MVKIGGEGIGVQFDETAICNGELIHSPSSTLHDKPNVQWLVEGVEKGSCRNFALKLILNRKVPTILDMFDDMLYPDLSLLLMVIHLTPGPLLNLDLSMK
ncbi:hypothetical protein NCER_102502 [Vairimorpha ceranae BRL01]|uniref:Uncharacterized protein n=1 Tax=Vairimorpha ceranae (strain BRL01) TaxID=578460 RepID=C4VC42_VAIC1|nr:hypothetical protein NCER_102502 [Vairimorpha ceranae BRL01]